MQNKQQFVLENYTNDSLKEVVLSEQEEFEYLTL